VAAVRGRCAWRLSDAVSTFCDGLETEINPRPEADLPLEFALSNMERRLLPFGVTTEFHAVAFMNMPRNRRTVQAAEARADYITAQRDSGGALVDHQILHRLDVWTPDSLDAIFASVERSPIKYISLNDHTPGQGQYRDLDGYWSDGGGRRRRGGQRPEREEVHGHRHAQRGPETLPLVYSRVRRNASDVARGRLSTTPPRGGSFMTSARG
jgi:alpha-D-ribose 1-methylphosphonate 5-triphosphate diphosphatase PhnM